MLFRSGGTGGSGIVIISYADVPGENVFLGNTTLVNNQTSTTVVATLSLDLTDQGPYLAPSTSNAATIQQWIQRTVNNYGSPFYANAATFTTISGPAGTSAYCGGVLIPDGRVIFPPFNATNVGTFNPATNTFATVASGGPSAGTNKYWPGVLAPDGRVIFCPRGAQNVGT